MADDSSKVVVAGSAGLAAGLLLGGRKAGASPVVVDSELLEALIQTIKQQNQQLSSLTAAISDLLAVLQPPGGNGEAPGITINLDKYFQNTQHIATGVLLLPQANIAMQMPIISIPDNFSIVITALTTNAGFIRIANSKAEAESAVAGYPLIAGAGIGVRVKRADYIWVAATVALEGIAWIVEQP